MVEKSELQKRENQISGITLDAAIAIYSALGPGLLESAYEACLCYELSSRGLKFQTQVPLPIQYGHITLGTAYRIDFLVEDLVIVELKAIEQLLPIHGAQLLSYLKLSGKKLGLLINFSCIAPQKRLQTHRKWPLIWFTAENAEAAEERRRGSEIHSGSPDDL